MFLDRTTLGTGDFITSTTLDYRSECEAELCVCLSALQRIDNFLSELNDFSKIDLTIGTDFLGVIGKLERQKIITSMSTKLYPIVREFFSFKSKRLRSLKFVKVVDH